MAKNALLPLLEILEYLIVLITRLNDEQNLPLSDSPD